ncbi:hypothetical protein NUW58_g6258 [Xylaria curta]|uniref:Uncharacterized protein n=1 Tax=Xylaria curta TaxID=42375 RepID=A0ACC1NWV2_9PEZI|nr:hypothetical protein NUW58_g6258 [Xylaria curta]
MRHPHDGPKKHRLYVALYNLGPVCHWALVVRNSEETFLLDATAGDGELLYRIRNWKNDLSKKTIAVLCDVMDLQNDHGVKILLDIAESAPIPDKEDQNFCQTWAESVLKKAGKNSPGLRAPIDQIRETVLHEASRCSGRKTAVSPKESSLSVAFVSSTSRGPLSPGPNPRIPEGCPSGDMLVGGDMPLSDGLERASARVQNTVNGLEADDELASYPEGGLEAWLVVLGAWCAMIPSMGLLNTLAILHAWVSDHELAGLPESTVGWIFSTYAFFLYFTGAQTGPIFDAYPVRLLVIPGSIGMVVSVFLFSVSKGILATPLLEFIAGSNVFLEFYQYLLSFGVLGGDVPLQLE